MKAIAIDTETELIRPGRTIPRLVCMTACGADLKPSIHHVHGDAGQTFLRYLKDPEWLLVFHNAPFDLAVLVEAAPDKEDALRAVFNALEAGRIRDTVIRQKLFHIRKGDLQSLRKGSLTLAALSKLYLGEEMAKGEDTWRLRYGELMRVLLTDWPLDAKEYALRDSVQTMRVFLSQCELFEKMKYTGAEPHSAKDEAFQLRAAWALHLIAAWGIRTNPEKVDALEASLRKEIEETSRQLKIHQIVRLDGSQDMGVLKSRVQAAFTQKGLRAPLTPGGDVSTSKDTLEMVVDVDPVLRAVHERKHSEKILNTFVKAARQGAVYPLTASYNVLLASTRTSCAGSKVSGGCNMQNLPKKNGVRQCFEARPRTVFCAADYATLEMRTWAQILYDLKQPDILRQALIAGRDPHIMVGLNFVSLSYEEFAKKYKEDASLEDLRDKMKPANYGFMGGLGPVKFVSYARQSNVKLSGVEEAKTIKQAWSNTWQCQGYFNWVNSLMHPVTQTALVPLRSGAMRGGCTYTVAANTPFQALAAYGAKEALWLIVRESYLDRKSDIYGSRCVAFIHDETLSEVPEEHADPAARRISQIMKEAMETHTPNVPQRADPKLMHSWDKAAKSVYEDGELIPWDAVDEAA